MICPACLGSGKTISRMNGPTPETMPCHFCAGMANVSEKKGKEFNDMVTKNGNEGGDVSLLDAIGSTLKMTGQAALEQGEIELGRRISVNMLEKVKGRFGDKYPLFLNNPLGDTAMMALLPILIQTAVKSYGSKIPGASQLEAMATLAIKSVSKEAMNQAIQFAIPLAAELFSLTQGMIADSLPVRATTEESQ